MIVKAEKISMRYFRKTGSANYFDAVKPVSLEIGAGEVAVLTGRSGSGKTTLLNMLSGLLKPAEGKVWINGTDLYSLDDRALSRFRNEKIGVVPQSRSIIDTLTVLENIRLPAKLYGKDVAPDVASQWMEKLGIGHLRDAFPAELSGGELRRAAIVRALVRHPDILFADEPTGDLDDENTALISSMFHAYAHEQNKAVFIVTHENDAMQYADSVYRMDSGRIICSPGIFSSSPPAPVAE